MKHRTLISGFVIGLLANYLLWGYWSGLCFPIFVAITVLCTLWNANVSGKKFDAGHAFLAASAILFSVFLAIRGAAGLSFANACLAFYFWLLLSHSLASERPLPSFGPWDYFRLPRRFGMMSLKAGSHDISESCHQVTGFSGMGDKEKEIRNGILIAIPVLLLFLSLMVLADASFQSFLSRIGNWIAELFKNINFFTLFGRTGFIYFTTALGAGTFFLFRERWECPSEPSPKPPTFSFLSGMIVMGLVNALFLVFAIFQVNFMLGQAQGYLATMTNRENFYLMMTIGLLAFLGSCALEGSLKRTTETESKIYRVNVILAGIFTLIVMASAYYRFVIYENAAGFTIRRFYAHSFVPYIALFYMLLIGKILGRWPRSTFLNGAMMLTTGLLLFWNVIDPHALVARKNAELIALNPRAVPPVYLQSLSYDAVPAVVDQLGKINFVDSNAENFLAWQKRIVGRFPQDSWRGLHMGRARASAALNQYETRTGRVLNHPEYMRKTSNIDSWVELVFCITIGLALVVFIISMVV